MSSSAGFESSANALVARSASQNSQLATPAQAEKSPVALDGRVFLRQLLADSQNLGYVGLGVGLGGEKLVHLFRLFLRVIRNHIHAEAAAFEKVGNQNQSTALSGQTVSALDGLRPDAEDVVNIDNSLGGILIANNVYGVVYQEAVDRSLESRQRKLLLQVLTPAMTSYFPFGS